MTEHETPDELLDRAALLKRIEDAVWAGDVDLLDEIAGCGCCCDEHYHLGCLAQLWGGCRGQGDMRGEERAWREHYAKFHGMSDETFYGMEERP